MNRTVSIGGPEMESSTSRGPRAGRSPLKPRRIPFLFIIVCFALPFLTVGCDGTDFSGAHSSTEFVGFELLTGATHQALDSGKLVEVRVERQWLAWLALLGTIVGFAGTYARRAELRSWPVAGASCALGALIALPIALDARIGVLVMSGTRMAGGYILAVLGALAALVGVSLAPALEQRRVPPGGAIQ